MLKLARLIITLMSCGVMFMIPSSETEFFRGLLILSMSYGYDYYSIRVIGISHDDKLDTILGSVGVFVACILFVICIAGLSEMLTINLESKPFMIMTSKKMMSDIEFPLSWCLMIVGIFPFLAGAEWLGTIRS